MDISTSFSRFQSGLQTLLRSGSSVGSSAFNVARPDPYQLHNKAYRDVLVSANILRKSVQLYNDITTAQNTTQAKLSAAQTYLSDIQTNGLNETLQAYLKQNTPATSSARGSTFDTQN